MKGFSWQHLSSWILRRGRHWPSRNRTFRVESAEVVRSLEQAVVGKIAASSAFTVSYVYTAELYPTIIR